MSSPFPQETVDLLSKRLAEIKKDFKKSTELHLFSGIINNLRNGSYYEFRENLRTGEYALYEHEMRKRSIFGFNCTTIIPSVYIMAEAYGLKPKIVQFSGYRNIFKEKDKEEPKEEATHFSLIIEDDAHHRFLVDPFQEIFGRILQQEDHRFKFAAAYGFSKGEREFDIMHYFSPEAFAAMMQELRDPAKSLDMLIAGQKVNTGRVYRSISCKQHVYFEEEERVLRTRLYVPRKMISDIAIEVMQHLSTEGDVLEHVVDLCFAQDHTWRTLVGESHLARTDVATIKALYTLIKKYYDPKKDGRLGPQILKQPEKEILEKVIEATKKTNAKSARRKVLARALYETEAPERKYLFTPEEHDQFLFGLRDEDLRLKAEWRPSNDRLWRAGWKWIDVSRTEKEKLKKQEKEYVERLSKIVGKVDFLNFLRRRQRPSYHSLLDRLLYSKQYEAATTEDLEQVANQRSIDVRIGQLAAINECIPFVLDAESELWLKPFMKSIQGKVKARYGMQPELPLQRTA